MADLTEMEQRVLAELQEFWVENVFSMINTIYDPTGDPHEVAMLQEALNGLVERDYVLMGFEGFVPRNPEKLGKKQSLELVSQLGDWFKFDSENSCWTLSKGDIKKERIPAIFSSAEAREKAFQILDERGYQWWRPKR
ncbi:MAG: hypothetical protein F9K29_24065 [Hyphomicrobiaceae bacterium]|nr:MAG: hypothetical protein F9K29_24065 [Hyphomicrobiaceae bacterium]